MRIRIQLNKIFYKLLYIIYFMQIHADRIHSPAQACGQCFEFRFGGLQDPIWIVNPDLGP